MVGGKGEGGADLAGGGGDGLDEVGKGGWRRRRGAGAVDGVKLPGGAGGARGDGGEEEEGHVGQGEGTGGGAIVTAVARGTGVEDEPVGGQVGAWVW